MARFKQPKKKFWRLLKYIWLRNVKENRKIERAEKMGLLCCEVCGRTQEEIFICSSCFRCNDPKCNAGCIFCRSILDNEYCKCCGHEI